MTSSDENVTTARTWLPKPASKAQWHQVQLKATVTTRFDVSVASNDQTILTAASAGGERCTGIASSLPSGQLPHAMMKHSGRGLGKISGYGEEERLGVTVTVTVTGVLSGRKDRHKWPQRAMGNTSVCP